MNRIILGLQFGDCGKGLFTDYLCSHSPDSLVVRFSGGHQAGHTVFTDETNHVFSNFGSGTLRGISTYWSKYCTVEPIGLLIELRLLLSKGISPILYIDEKCPITTPSDIFYNQDTEKNNNHGSCGVGFGSTIEREEKHYSLTFLDLFYPDIFYKKEELIRKKYYNFDFKDNLYINKLKEFYEACDIISDIPHIKLVDSFPKYNEYIFEGSQGLLLDQNFGFFPHVTRSNTGCKNVFKITGEEWVCFDLSEVFLVTRAYQTRHGNGFMTNEDIPHNIKENPLETNQEHPYQGKFRRSLLDVSLLEYGINKDEYINSLQKNLVITCLDSVINEYRFTYKGEIYNCVNEKEFINKISDILKINKVYISRSNNSKNIERWS